MGILGERPIEEMAAGLLERLDLPDEILASALFRLLGDVDGRSVGRVATGAGGTVASSAASRA